MNSNNIIVNSFLFSTPLISYHDRFPLLLLTNKTFLQYSSFTPYFIMHVLPRISELTFRPYLDRPDLFRMRFSHFLRFLTTHCSSTLQFVSRLDFFVKNVFMRNSDIDDRGEKLFTCYDFLVGLLKNTRYFSSSVRFFGSFEALSLKQVCVVIPQFRFLEEVNFASLINKNDDEDQRSGYLGSRGYRKDVSVEFPLAKLITGYHGNTLRKLTLSFSETSCLTFHNFAEIICPNLPKLEVLIIDEVEDAFFIEPTSFINVGSHLDLIDEAEENADDVVEAMQKSGMLYRLCVLSFGPTTPEVAPSHCGFSSKVISRMVGFDDSNNNDNAEKTCCDDAPPICCLQELYFPDGESLLDVDSTRTICSSLPESLKKLSIVGNEYVKSIHVIEMISTRLGVNHLTHLNLEGCGEIGFRNDSNVINRNPEEKEIIRRKLLLELFSAEYFPHLEVLKLFGAAVFENILGSSSRNDDEEEEEDNGHITESSQALESETETLKNIMSSRVVKALSNMNRKGLKEISFSTKIDLRALQVLLGKGNDGDESLNFPALQFLEIHRIYFDKIKGTKERDAIVNDRQDVILKTRTY